MSTVKQSKIKLLLSNQPSGVVLSSSWLADQGYSYELQKRYKRSRWFESIGKGALIRHDDDVDYLGGIYALQTQLGLSVHPAAKHALALQGKTHYLLFSAKEVQLFGTKGESLPTWFKNRDWNVKILCKFSAMLPAQLGLVEVEHKGFTVKVSNSARAIMECLYLAPKHQDLSEALELMEGLNNLRPASVQALLEACSSVKVKRLFLYMAEKVGHQWLEFVNLDKVDLGAGKRSIVRDGAYVSKYQITVPKEWEGDNA